MAIAVLAFMLLLQLPRIFGFGDLLQSKDCGANWVAYSYSHGEELFYINGNVVSKDTFCKTLQLYMVNGCDAKYYFGSTSCGLEVSFGRKLLQKDISNNSTFPGHKNVSIPLSASKVDIAASGVLFVCCVFLCPCFYGKKQKATAHAGLSKDPNSMDLASSLEGNSVSEKTPQGCLHRVPPSPSRFSMSPKLSRLGSIHLNLSQVIKATHNFSNKLQIGEGGFGTVYKAQLEGGQVVAVKRAKREQFENLKTEFSSKVELLAKIDHRNLVKLLGYIDQGNERLLIAEYVPNGTLREHLDGLRGRILDFNQRLEIAIDVAHGLTYLHRYAEKPIIHRDVRSSNILLTESMRAKVADFGFARLGPVDSDQTHISTKVKGTVGYLDPEYMKTYQLTPKSDVYSFGILLIEIVTGRRPVEVKKPVEERVTLRWTGEVILKLTLNRWYFLQDKHLPRIPGKSGVYACWLTKYKELIAEHMSYDCDLFQAFRKYTEGNVAEMADPLMEEGINGEVLMKMIGLAIQCAAPSRADRPDMKSVGEQLWTIRAEFLKSSKKI